MIKILSSNVDFQPDVIPMGNMKPLQLAVIVDQVNTRHAGHVVMRTASVDDLEVMDLSDAHADNCWTGIPQDRGLSVRILNPNESLTIVLRNTGKEYLS